jgi:hypothetical protein
MEYTKLHPLEDALTAVKMKFSTEEIAVLEEPYVPHAVVGFVQAFRWAM